MKKIFLASIILVSTIAIGQKKEKKKDTNEDLILFEKTVTMQEMLDIELNSYIYKTDTLNLSNEDKIKRSLAIEINESILQKVIKNYDDLIKEYPKSKHLFRALNNKAFAQLELKNYEKAKETFLQIINSQANDNEKGGIGSGLMSEPYANYKNRALTTLANLEIENKNYQEAITYINETKKYPYRHFCGNAYAADELYMIELLSQCYLGLNQDEKALDILLPKILDNGLASNEEIVEISIKTLLKTYTKEELKTLFQNSFKNVFSEKETDKKYKNPHNYYFIIFLNRKIKLESWEYYGSLTELEKETALNNIIEESGFFNLLKK